MAFKIGSTDFTKAYLGTTEIDNIQLGQTEIHSASSLITDGLVLNLQSDQYSGTGTSWPDLSSTGATVTLSTTGFGSSFYGTYGGINNVLRFPSSSSYYATISNNAAFDFSAAQSVYILSYPLNDSGRQNYWDQAYGGEGTWTREGNGIINCFFGDSGGNASPYIGAGSGTSVTLNAWQSWCFTRNTSNWHWYKNGTQTSTGTHSYNTVPNTTQNIRIGRGYTNVGLDAYMFAVLAYTKKLTQAEIQANDDYFNNKLGLSL